MYNTRILSLLFIAPILFSCSSSKDDPFVPTPEQEESISFGGNSGAWQDAPTTRAGKTGLESLFKTFRVWGYKTTATDATQQQLVMDGYKVVYITDGAGSTESNTNGWEYVGIENPKTNTQQTIKYWDHSASTYRFFAYSPFDATVSVDKKTDGSSSSNAPSSSDGVSTPVVQFSFPFEYSDAATATSLPYITDLWLARKGETTGSSSSGSSTGSSSTGSSSDGVSTPVAKYGSPVTLTFSPLLAKVRFRFTYPTDTKSITISDINFRDSRFINDPTTADTPLKGTINTAYPLTGIPESTTPTFSWTASSSTDATGQLLFTIPYEEKDAAIHIQPAIAEYEKWYYVPPLNIIPYKQGAYTITAHVDGNFATATVPAQFMQWKAGYQYTYIFKITEAGSMITFSNLQVEEWLPGTEIENQGSGTERW